MVTDPEIESGSWAMPRYDLGFFSCFSGYADGKLAFPSRLYTNIAGTPLGVAGAWLTRCRAYGCSRSLCCMYVRFRGRFSQLARQCS